MAQGSAKIGKVQIVRMLSGMLVGAAGALLFLTLAGKSRIDLHDPGIALAVVVGLCYALMGLAVGVGALLPGAGARFLNVEDEEELREQRPSLAPSAIACVAIGLFLLVLSLAPSLAASFGREAVAAAAIGALVIAVLITVATRRRADELVRQISVESSALALHILLIGLGIWAALAHVGLVGWMSPLALVAGCALLHLLAIFFVSGRKGLLRPR
jgi:hypothetical protein